MMKKIINKTENGVPSVKRRRIRVWIELGVFLLGVLTVVLTRTAFGGYQVRMPYANDVSADDFGLYFKLSLIICSVLLGLTLLSAVTYIFQRSVSRFQRITVSMAPIICSVTVFVMSVFYAYLTSGSVVNITGFLLALGAGEAMLFRLPCALYVMLRAVKR